VTPLGRIVLVTASPRTPPGVLSWPAWQALRAGPVLLPVGPDGDEPAQAAALREAGVLVEVVAPAEVGALLTARAGSGQTATALVSPGLPRSSRAPPTAPVRDCSTSST
jgi:XTP/dITP diphosphohydrolase